MFQPVPSNVRFPALEEEILQFWRERRVYEQSLARRRNAPRFVFYEGPPTANGMPHPGHCLTRAIKDLFPRYRTMRGFYCERKGGWDTHGLPVEVEVCKELGIHSKEEIEQFGVEPFIQKCQQSVWRYMKEWERLTERLGFWIHLDDAYVTYHQSYVESVWWSLKNLFDRGLLYQSYKIVWWWAQGGTALSSGEVGQGYREVADPSVYVRFPLVDEPETSLVVWTTTPWTLPSNHFAAVHPELTYAKVHDPETGEHLILAADLVESVAAKVKRTWTVVATYRGLELIGRRYRPPFDFYYAKLGDKTGRLRDGGSASLGWRVLPASFVTTDSGTGVVHQAPAFGEVDYEVLVADQSRFVEGERPPLLCAVGPDGRFTAEAPTYEGRWVKEADKDICRAMRASGALLHQEQYVHEYPFCWRADDDPLIQYPRKSWFIRTTQFRDRMLENNRQIHWLPEHIRDGRFGNFLESNVDWALSRERYWGTPLPIWVCSRTGKMEAIDQYETLLAKPGISGVEVWTQAREHDPSLPEDLRVHKPYIDAITYDSPFHQKGRMHRVPDVIDCWYDSGAMPFAQWGYPHAGAERFRSSFPADFISEALDQTRGWFYSQLAISTLLFGDERQPDPAAELADFPHPFRNCIVLGLMLGEDGEKMSKSKRNYREPKEIFDRYGADALRWYFFANQPPWTSIRYSELAIKESIPEFLLRLWNVYSFFVIYANIDGFDPGRAGIANDGRSRGQEGPSIANPSIANPSMANPSTANPSTANPSTANPSTPNPSIASPGAENQLTADDLARGRGHRPVRERSELDRWVISELHRAVAAVIEKMDGYDNFGACQRITEFVDGLSNWYVRRSRDRFWSGDTESPDKQDAYWTLYECLLTTCKLIAPFTPFLAESLWRNLAGACGENVVESVHLCDYPSLDDTVIDDKLSQQMRLLREIASLGRAARMDAKLKVRQPLQKVRVVLADATHQSWLEAHDELLRVELNVKEIEYSKDAALYVTYQVQPNFKRLGPRLGKLMPPVKKAITEAEGSALLAQLNATGKVVVEASGERVELDGEDIQVRLQAKEGWIAAQGSACVVVLSSDLTPELIREGLANDLLRYIQDRRKELDCAYTDRIDVEIASDSEEIHRAVDENRDRLMSETLAMRLEIGGSATGDSVVHQVGGSDVSIFVRVLSGSSPSSR